MIVLYVFMLLALFYGVLMGIYRYGWDHLKEYDPDLQHVHEDVHVSVIIPARNEAAHIQSCLHAICRQHYPPDKMEILVIDDDSTDDTAQRVREIKDPRIRLLHVSDYVSHESRQRAPKKKAIELGVAHAHGELIITTDADCVAEPDWIKTIVSFYRQYHAVCMAAPVTYANEKSFFDIFQSLDFMTMQGITAATDHLKIGTMCNGANLAYSREAFYEVDGFTGIDGLASGDDMLLMYKLYRAYPDRVFYIKSRKAIVKTTPVNGLKAFWHQRVRWASKAGKFDDKRLTWVLAGVYCWNLAFCVLFFAGFFHARWWLWALGLLLYKTVVELCFLIPVAAFFQKKHLLWYFLPGQFLHIPYIVSTGLWSLWSRYQWKDRKLK
ncbi:MAG: glycosyltransferase [Thermoflavifilum aggregans]|nr:glycosyltransferase [Thermoflavifilum aggregans]